jgi:hypothetical protein
MTSTGAKPESMSKGGSEKRDFERCRAEFEYEGQVEDDCILREGHEGDHHGTFGLWNQSIDERVKRLEELREYLRTHTWNGKPIKESA